MLDKTLIANFFDILFNEFNVYYVAIQISISLTPAGFENWKSIVTILYSFIGVIEQVRKHHYSVLTVY